MRRYLLSTCLIGSALLGQPLLAQTVTVRPGDTLFSIASAQMGEGRKWPELCAFNADVLAGNCDLVVTGMVLRIPGADASAAAPAAEPAPDPAPMGETAPAATADAPAAETPPSETPPDETPAATALADDAISDVVYDFGTADAARFIAPAGFTADHRPDEGFVRLSGHVEGALSSGRPGVHLTIPSQTETAFAGREIIVEMLARLDMPGRIEIAYSAGDAGDSGWRSFDLGTAYDRVAMRYTVPADMDGGMDYLGFLPDPDATGQTLDISFIGVAVLE
jgi:hypothetical protein